MLKKNRRIFALSAAAALTLLLALSTVLALMDGLHWPEASGSASRTSEKLTVDYSHADLGYVMVKGPETQKKLKLIVKKEDRESRYDLNGRREWEIIPLQFGSGKYTLTLYVNASKNNYTAGGRVSVTAEFSRPNAAFLVPNQYVNYGADTPLVALSDEICAGLSTDREKFDAIRAYIKSNYVYDYVKAATVTTGTLPDIEGAYAKGMGICQDLAAIAVCMLRVQGIPAQLMIGHVGNNYHAWSSALIDGEGVRYDPTLEVQGATTNAAYKVERYY